MINHIQRFLILVLLLGAVLTACAPGATVQDSTEPPIASTSTLPDATSQSIVTEEPTVLPPSEPIKLKVLVLPYLSYAPFFIAQEEGLFEEQGLDVEFLRIDDSGEFTPALAQGQLDVAADMLSVGTLNAIAQGSKIKYVADKGYLDPAGCTYTGWAIRKDLLESGVLNDLKNLAGMKVSTSATTSGEFLLDMVLKDVGLSSEDVEIIDLPPPARLEALKTGAIDIASVAEPWNTRIMNEGAGDIWKGWEDIFPNFELSMIIFGPTLLEKNPEAGKRFMVAYLKAVDLYNQGKTDRNVEIISKYTELPPETVKQACWQTIKADGSINSQSILDFQDWAIAKGYQDSALNLEELWDSTYINYANQVLK